MNDTNEKTAGTNLCQVPEYNDTALALADLRHRFGNVVYDVTKPKEMKLAKEGRAEVKKYRTDLEKKRVEIKAPALERCRLIDAEAKRITAELIAIEEPLDLQIKAEETRAEAEKLAKLQAEQARVQGHRDYINGLRELPSTLVGRPAAGIEAAIRKLEAADKPDCEEFQAEADDAFAAAVLRISAMLDSARAHETEQARVREQEGELQAMRDREAQREREDQERAKRERQAERQREIEAQAEANRVEAERLAAERKAQSAQAEAARKAALTLNTAAQAVIDLCVARGLGDEQAVKDLNELLLTEVKA